MKIFIGIVIFCAFYYAFACVVGIKLAKQVKERQEQKQEVMSELLKANGVFDIFNVNGKDLK